MTPTDLLDQVVAFLRRFVAFPSEHHADAVALWVAHAHVLDAFESTPRLALLSPEPASGKTRTLEVVELLVPNPMHALSASPAPIFRSIEEDRPTLLFDEVDALFGRRGSDDGAEDLRGLLNAGHRTGATIPRCVGPRHDVRRFPVYAAAALAGLGDLPDTLMSRAVIIRMRRRAPGEDVEPFRHRVAAPEGHHLRDQLADWGAGVLDDLHGAWPEMPPGVADRSADCWEPLLALADAAGGHWPQTARAACVELVKVTESREASLGIRLLADLRHVFGGDDRLATETILDRLHKLEEAPWSDLRGRPLDARGLARRLGGYGIKPTQVKLAGEKYRGYRREDLYDAWVRYLPAPPPGEAVPAVPAVPAWSEPTPPAPLPFEVPVPANAAVPPTPPPTRGVPEVPQVPHPAGQEPACDECGAPARRYLNGDRCDEHAP